mmetsp:Transcript_33455/g.72232  ORF Transcript_33455/g.72232 Transcript_33455/m.72232 type:complete len:244 (-) Transcript_33455:75-806(-)
MPCLTSCAVVLCVVEEVLGAEEVLDDGVPHGAHQRVVDLQKKAHRPGPHRQREAPLQPPALEIPQRRTHVAAVAIDGRRQAVRENDGVLQRTAAPLPEVWRHRVERIPGDCDRPGPGEGRRRQPAVTDGPRHHPLAGRRRDDLPDSVAPRPYQRLHLPAQLFLAAAAVSAPLPRPTLLRVEADKPIDVSARERVHSRSGTLAQNLPHHARLEGHAAGFELRHAADGRVASKAGPREREGLADI